MDTNKFLSTNLEEYLEKDKRENCVSFKEFLKENKKVLQFKYAANMNSDYGSHYPKHKNVPKQTIWNID